MFRLHRRVGMKNSSYLPAYEDGTECSETSAYKFQMPGNYPEERIQLTRNVSATTFDYFREYMSHKRYI